MSISSDSPSHRWRWLVLGVFILSSALNFLDRQILAQLAPVLQEELGLSLVQYGWLISAFSALYAVSAPLAGWFLDRLGLNRGMSLAVALWSLAGVATGFALGFWSLVICRSVLAVGESAGVPGTGKALRHYLPAKEYALGHAAGQFGLSIGGVLAPPMATWFALNSDWRYAFLVAGAFGFIWIPLWLLVSRRFPPAAEQRSDAGSPARPGLVLHDPRMWGLFAGNILCMVTYSLWLNWTTVFLVRAHGLRLEETKWLAGLPPVFLTLGGICGGLLALRWIRNPSEAFEGRMKVSWLAASLMLVNAAVPFLPGAELAIAGICAACFWTVAFSVNLYSMPLDLFDSRYVAFSVSLLTSAYGVLQFLISPLIGKLVEDAGFLVVCLLTAPTGLLACAVIKAAARWGPSQSGLSAVSGDSAG